MNKDNGRDYKKAEKDEMMRSLVADYEDYLSDFTIEEIGLIVKSGGFTLTEVKNR